MAHQEGSELDRDLVVGVPTDQEIEINIKDALAWNDRLDASRIRVGVCSSAVTLKGYVDTEDEKQLAEEIASRVPGVTDLENDIQVIGDAACD